GLKNNGRPSVLLSTEQILPDGTKKNLAESWGRQYAGADNAGKTAVLDRGLKAQPLSFSNEQTQLVALMQASVRDVANFTGVPASKLGDPTGRNYSTLDQESLAWLDEGLDPWFVCWETQFWD